MLQVGNGACDLLLSAGRQRTLVSGERLEYLAGDIEYFTDHVFRRWWSLLGVKRPFFVVNGTDPSESIAAVTGCDTQPLPRLCLSTHCVVVIMANWRGTPAVLHYAACDKAIAELGRQANSLGIASSDPQIRHLVPRLLAHANLENGAAVLVQSRIPAGSFEFSWRRIDAATELWLSRNPRSEDGGRAWVGQRLVQLCAFLPRFQDLLIPATDALLDWCEAARIPGDLTHGDFWLGNVLFSGDTVSGIIDWEWAQKDGFVLVDALYMLLMSTAAANGGRVSHYLRQLWADEIGDAALQERIAKLRIQSGMDKDDLKFIALLLWFGVLWQKAMRGGMPSTSWLEDMIPRTMPAIEKWLSRCSKTSGICAA
ncbi:MAG TPA: phosphotransferase [Edaphobacter sp.]|uniref:phosphotransferase n=1 Tax=Edaphobacter sp. TaxID=1934404 RepID=UPI002C29AA07|nr:phosphotransferase [Edaphobacter sp.]HUZ97330.1 phosphotransferase [Edaphobacter sp.]